MAKNVTLTLTSAQAQALMALLGGVADNAPTATAPTATTKSLSKADLNRKDGTVRKDGKVWLVTAKGDRSWVSQSSYDYVQKKRAYASGKVVKVERTDEEKAEFKDKYAKKWDKWTKSKEYKALSKSERKDANKAMHKQIIAELSK